MVSVDKAVIAHLTRAGHTFEIMVDPEKALDFRKGKPYGMESILAVNGIFKDVKKGDRASTADLEKAFATSDVFKVAEIIIKTGEVQLTTDQRRKMTEEKRKEVVDTISRLCVNPQTGYPHPPQRIENALTEAHVTVDPNRPAKDQLREIMEKIQPILPLKIERLEVAVKVPMAHAGRASSAIRQLAAVKKEEWTNDGWIALIEIPAGIQGDIFSRLNNLTAGTVETKIVRRLEG